MPSESQVVEGGRIEGLPSHLTMAQAARLLGVTDSAIWQRCDRGVLPSVLVLGVRMIPTLAAVLEFNGPAPLSALPMSSVMDLLSRAATRCSDGRGDLPEFSSSEIAGVFFALAHSEGILPCPFRK